MQAFLFAFGKLKNPGMREAADYYKKLCNTWTSLQEFELKPLQVPDKSPATRIHIQEKEGEILLEKISQTVKSRTLIVLLDETGKLLTSEQWAQNWLNWESQGNPSIAFCIGSSLGFSQKVRAQAHARLSLGLQTLPHELARVVLLEQIFRSQSILKGHPYHNSGT